MKMSKLISLLSLHGNKGGVKVVVLDGVDLLLIYLKK